MTDEPAAVGEADEETAEEEVIEEDLDLDEIEEYDTPKGLAEPLYQYEKDENGKLVLDENGNPILINAAEGAEIPVTFWRDENGELILDENGDPIPTQTVPADAVVIETLQDSLNPDRTIDIYYSWNNMQPAIGVDVTFIAVLHGYENLEYTIQWQQSSNNADWSDIAGSRELRHTETITRENYKDFWRVQVKINDPAA